MQILSVRNVFKQFVLFILISPIFISLDFSAGLRFDANPYNYLGLPSIPLSLFVLLSLFLLTFRKIIINKDLLILFSLMSIFLVLNLFNGSFIRALIVFFGMFIPVVSFYIFLEFFKKNNIYANLYNNLIFVLYLKLITDVIFFGKIISPNFILNKVLIYNYYDYFPFFYYIIACLSVYNIIINYRLKTSLFTLIVIFIILFFLDSRLFQVGLFLLPLNILIYNIVKFKLSIFYNIMFAIVIVLTLLVSMLEYIPDEVSLAERFSHWIHYFEAFSFINFIFPFFNEYRIGYAKFGTLHNEFLEQFSYFGIIVFYYYFVVVKKIFINVIDLFKLSSYLIMFILIFGMLIQSNFSNPYIGILLGLIFAILNKKLQR